VTGTPGEFGKPDDGVRELQHRGEVGVVVIGDAEDMRRNGELAGDAGE